MGLEEICESMTPFDPAKATMLSQKEAAFKIASYLEQLGT